MNITLNEIEKFMDKEIRPELLLHGGNIVVTSYTDDVLTVRLTGQCSGCPSASLTMENIVESKFAEGMPSIKKVCLESGVSDTLINEALAILKKNHKSI